MTVASRGATRSDSNFGATQKFGQRTDGKEHGTSQPILRVVSLKRHFLLY